MSMLSARPSTMTEREFDDPGLPCRAGEGLYTGLDRLEERVTEYLASYGILLMRVGLGIVFSWFGVLKVFPGASPGEDLVGRTIDALTLGLVPPQVSLRLLATAETLIGLGLISGIWLRVALVVLLLQMLGTLTPLVLFPALTFAHPPYAPTLEGQYILKNIVLVTAALTIGATVRGARLVADPLPAGDYREGLPDLGGPPGPRRTTHATGSSPVHDSAA